MHLNRRGKGLVPKQLASEIWNLSAAEEMPSISFFISSYNLLTFHKSDTETRMWN
jgi:hypothetical protein